MKTHWRFWARGGALAILALLLLVGLNTIILPKKMYNQNWPSTAVYLEFYEMRKNTVDVLFLGSSQCVSAFSPQEIYDNFGLRSYNLGIEQQNLLTSYYWLQEALRYQQPQTVVLDTLLCFDYNTSEPLNSSESATRLAFDFMRWSPVKMAAVAAICENDENQNASSYYFTNIRFHTRWTVLNEDDFTLAEQNGQLLMKGFSLLAGWCGNQKYVPFAAGETEPLEMVPLMQEYLDKIVALCREQGINLILVKTPRSSWNLQKHNAVAAYAAAQNIAFYDFNEKDLYEEIGYQFAVDNNDNSHVNYWGAQKISAKIGEILLNEYGVQLRADAQWEESREFYQNMAQNAELAHITDIYEYLAALQEARYSVFIAVKDEASNALNEEIIGLMQNLGLQFDLAEKYRSSYYAVIDGGQVREAVSDEALADSGSFRAGRCTWQVSSAGYEVGNSCSIQLNRVEYAKKQRGLNIVVYDNEVRKVVDSVCFDTCAASLAAVR